jgi:hypothetical protein
MFMQDHWESNLGTDGPGSDAHHLRASDITLNATRNYPFGCWFWEFKT